MSVGSLTGINRYSGFFCMNYPETGSQLIQLLPSTNHSIYDTIHACYYLFVIRSYYLFHIPATTYRELVVLPVVSLLHVVI